MLVVAASPAASFQDGEAEADDKAGTNEAEADDKVDARRALYSEQLAESRAAMTALLGGTATAKLAELDGDFDEWMDWLLLKATQQLDSLSEAHQTTARDALRVQTVEAKLQLAISRTAAQVDHDNVSAMQLFEFHKRLEHQHEGDVAALEVAHREAEAARRELNALKIKCVGVQDVSRGGPGDSNRPDPPTHTLCSTAHRT